MYGLRQSGPWRYSVSPPPPSPSWQEFMESAQSRHQSSHPMIPLGLEDMGLFSAGGIEMQASRPGNCRPAVEPQRLFSLSGFCCLHWMWTARSPFVFWKCHAALCVHVFLTEESDDEMYSARFLLKLCGPTISSDEHTLEMLVISINSHEL